MARPQTVHLLSYPNPPPRGFCRRIKFDKWGYEKFSHIILFAHFVWGMKIFGTFTDLLPPPRTCQT